MPEAEAQPLRHVPRGAREGLGSPSRAILRAGAHWHTVFKAFRHARGSHVMGMMAHRHIQGLIQNKLIKLHAPQTGFGELFGNVVGDSANRFYYPVPSDANHGLFSSRQAGPVLCSGRYGSICSVTAHTPSQLFRRPGS